MYLEILAACKDLATPGMGAGEGFLASVDAYVVDQLVLGLEGAPIAGAADPEAGVRGALRPAHMLHSEMRHDLVHGVKDLVARLAPLLLLLLQTQPRRLIGIYPEALHLLLNTRRCRRWLMPHVTQEGSSSGGMHRGHGMGGMRVGVGHGVGGMMMCRMHCSRRELAVVMVMLGIGGMCCICRMMLMVMVMTVERMLAKAAAQLSCSCLRREAGEEHRVRTRCCCCCCCCIVAGIVAASPQEKVT